MLSGCIIEEDIDYSGNDIEPHGYRKIMESQQACADFCKTIMGGKFWSWSSGDKLCYVKSSNSGRKSVSGKVSGNRECGSGKDIQWNMCSCSMAQMNFMSYSYQVNNFQPVNDFQSTSMSRPAPNSWPTLWHRPCRSPGLPLRRRPLLLRKMLLQLRLLLCYGCRD